jgi:hypothetical protein
MAQGKDCGHISDGCGGMIYCGNCGTTQACGANGTPNVCAMAEQVVCATQSCPGGYTQVASLSTNITYSNCSGGNCAAPAMIIDCVVSNLASQVMQGCGLQCPSGYSLLDTLVSCNCPNPPSFYNLCLPN